MERPQVASVFVNRLKQGWKLETDPTVIYGLGERYNGKIYKKDLQEATPLQHLRYRWFTANTHCNAKWSGIKSGFSARQHALLFLCADGTGGHKFSRSLNEHNQAVKEWRKIERERKQTTEGTKWYGVNLLC